MILIGYDGSSGARRAVERAGSLFPGQSALIVTAWVGATEAAPELMLAPGGVVMATIAALGDAMRERAEELAAEGAELATAAGLAAESRAVHSGRAQWEALVSCAEGSGAAAIVLGSRGYSVVTSAMLGSVTTGVLNNAARPVLIVPDR